MRTWGKVAQLTDALVAETGSVFVAAHAYVAKWREVNNPITMTSLGDGSVQKRGQSGMCLITQWT